MPSSHPGTAEDKKLANLFFRVLIVIALLTGGVSLHFLCAYLQTNFYQQGDTVPLKVLSNVANALVLAGIFSFLWDYRVKKRLIDEIVETTSTPRDIINSGLKSIYFDYCEVEWKTLINGSYEQIDIMFVIGESWASGYKLSLIHHFEKIKQSQLKINLFLPDYNNPLVINEILGRHGHARDNSNMQRHDIIRSIGRTIEIFLEFKESYSNFDINIYLCNFCPTFSIYRFDDNMLIAFASHLQKAKVPHCLIKKDSDFYRFGNQQFEILKTDKKNVNKLKHTNLTDMSQDLSMILYKLNPQQ